MGTKRCGNGTTESNAHDMQDERKEVSEIRRTIKNFHTQSLTVTDYLLS